MLRHPAAFTVRRCSGAICGVRAATSRVCMTRSTSKDTFVPEPHMNASSLADLRVEERRIPPVSGQVTGKFELIFGPMFAGKSTELIRRVRQEVAAGRSVAVIKSSVDTRYKCKHVNTHTGDHIPCITVDRLSPILADPGLMGNDVIAVDEAQFFPDLVEFVTQAVETHHKAVLVAGLDGDYNRQKFGQVLDLVPLADSITKLSGTCRFCTAKSLFSFRVVADGRQKLVGGSDTYVPTCRHHYVHLTKVRETPVDL